MVSNSLLLGCIWLVKSSDQSKRNLKWATIGIILTIAIDFYGIYWVSSEGDHPKIAEELTSELPTHLDPSLPDRTITIILHMAVERTYEDLNMAKAFVLKQHLLMEVKCFQNGRVKKPNGESDIGVLG